MSTWIRPPHPALRGVVDDYVGYEERLDPKLVHHGLPSPRITLIWAFDTPIDVGWLDEPTSTRVWAMASGLHLRPALIRPHGYQCGLQLALTPAGCRRILGVPAAALAGQVIDVASLRPELAGPTHERLAAARSWRERFRIVDAALLQAARCDAQPDPGVARAWALLSAADRPRVAAVAREVARSERWLSARFHAEFGISPVQASRLHRFSRALARARTGRPLADVAAETGYADQAHLTRDWQSLGGLAPTRLLHSTYRILQDSPAIGPAR